MGITVLVCFLISLAVVVSWLRDRADIFSPARTFVLVWSVSIGLAGLKLSDYQATWSSYAWIVLSIGLASFLVGFWIVYALHLGTPLLPVEEIRKRFSNSTIDQRRLFRVIVVLFVGYLLCYIAEVQLEGYLPIFSAHPDRARIEFGVFGLHLVVTTMPAILFLIVEYITLIKGYAGRKVFFGIVFFVAFVSFFFLLQRFAFVVWILLTIPFLYYTSRIMKFKYVLFAGTVFLALLIYLESFRVAQYVQNYIYVISRMRYSGAYAVMTEPYMYVVMNLENFARGVEKLDFFTWGLFSADFLMALTGLKHWLREYFSLVERPFLVSGYNTFPFLWQYYYDFGVVGVAMIPLLLGFLIGHIYCLVRSRPSLMILSVYSTCFFFLVISFFTNALTMLSTVFNMVLLVVIHIYVEKGSFIAKTSTPM